MAKLSDAHTPILRAYFGMIRRWAYLMKPNGKNDAQLVLDALDADETDAPGLGMTSVSCQGRTVFQVWTQPDRWGNPQTRSSLMLPEGAEPPMEGPPPPSAG